MCSQLMHVNFMQFITSELSTNKQCGICISVFDSQGQRGPPGDPAKGVKLMSQNASVSHLTRFWLRVDYC